MSYIRPFAVNALEIEELQIGYFFIFRDQEPTELLLSMGFLLFTLIAYRKVKNIDQDLNTRQTGTPKERASFSGRRDKIPATSERPGTVKKKTKEAT